MPRSTSWLLIGALASARLLPGVHTSAQAQSNRSPYLVARLESGNNVTVWDSAAGKWRRIYHGDTWSTLDLTVSPDQRYLALIELKQGVVTGVSYSTPPRGSLVVIRPDGRVVRRVTRDVQRYVWCCGPGRLVYVEGTYREADEVCGFGPAAAHLLDIGTGKETSFPEALGKFCVMWWVEPDSSLYVKHGYGARVVWRYHVPDGAVARTAYHDLNLSPSGRHYLWMPSGGTPPEAQVFETATNQQVSLPDRRALGGPVRWVFGHGDWLLLGGGQGTGAASPPLKLAPSVAPRARLVRPVAPPRDVPLVIYDVTAHAAVATFQGQLTRWSVCCNALVITSAGKLRVMDRP